MLDKKIEQIEAKLDAQADTGSLGGDGDGATSMRNDETLMMVRDQLVATRL